MKNYVIINGVNSNTITGLMINELPPITKPQMRVQSEEIDGRDGDITTNLGYSAYDKTITIGLFGTGYDINNIVAFFNGEGTIVFSNESDKYYNFKIINQIDYSALQKFKFASVTFHCQPFKYPTNETPVEIEYEYVEQDNVESASMNNTEGETYLGISLKGNTSQYTTTGANILPMATYTREDYGVNISCENNSMNLNGTQTDAPDPTAGRIISLLSNNGSNYDSYDSSTGYLTLSAGTYTLKFITISGSVNNDWHPFISVVTGTTNPKPRIAKVYENSTGTFTLAEETIVRINMTFKGTFTNYKIRATLTKSSTATDELYTGSIPAPNPDYPQEIHSVSGDNTIKVEGEQLFNKDSGFRLGYINSSGQFVSENLTAVFNQYIIVEPNTNYKLKFKSNVRNAKLIYYDKNKTYISQTNWADYLSTFTATIPNNIKYAVVQFSYDIGITMTQEIIDSLEVMLNKGDTALPYSPYQSQTYPINLPVDMELCKIGTYQDYFTKNSGKNLINSVETHNGISNSGVIGADNTYLGITDYVSCKPSTTYTITFEHDKPNSSLYLGYKDENGTFIDRTYQSGRTFTTPNNAYQLFAYVYDGNGFTIGGYVMLNEGATALPYEPYGTGQWCKYNAIGKVVLDGSETWGYYDNYFYSQKNDVLWKQAGYRQVALSNYFTNGYASLDNLKFQLQNQGANGISELHIRNDSYDRNTLNDFKTWLSTLDAVFYYPINPYLSLIEDTNLIEQLDNIQNAMSYKGTTNISQVNNDKPFLMDLKAMKKDTNEVTINNIGNTTSKPLIELVGNGNIDIYLNGNQVLQANVDEKMNIDIDKLEAYNPDTSALLNRQVIGNYNSMTLQSGNNTIKMSGNLSTATISNYTRWI